MVDIAVQRATSFTPLPSDQQFERWVSAALHKHGDADLLIRLVDRQESRQLNARYCHKNIATNVLSFPADLPEEVGLALLGDIVICAPIVAEEAQDQHKPPRPTGPTSPFTAFFTCWVMTTRVKGKHLKWNPSKPESCNLWAFPTLTIAE